MPKPLPAWHESRSSIENPSWGCLIAVWGNLYVRLRPETRGGLCVIYMDKKIIEISRQEIEALETKAFRWGIFSGAVGMFFLICLLVQLLDPSFWTVSL